MALALLAVVFAGFSRTFFLRAWFPEVRHLAPVEPYFYFHGTVFAAWFLLLVLQPSLVALRRVDVHRKLGWFGAGLAATMVVLGVLAALIAARRPTGFIGIPAAADEFLLTPLADMALFALFVSLALARRGDPQSHKRLMLVGSISILDAAVARLPFISLTSPLAYFGGTDLFLAPLVIWDVATRGRLHPVTLWGGLLLIASQPLRLWGSTTDPWLRLASWMIG
jgi:hypothetical protein